MTKSLKLKGFISSNHAQIDLKLQWLANVFEWDVSMEQKTETSTMKICMYVHIRVQREREYFTLKVLQRTASKTSSKSVKLFNGDSNVRTLFCLFQSFFTFNRSTKSPRFQKSVKSLKNPLNLASNDQATISTA